MPTSNHLINTYLSLHCAMTQNPNLTEAFQEPLKEPSALNHTEQPVLDSTNMSCLEVYKHCIACIYHRHAHPTKQHTHTHTNKCIRIIHADSDVVCTQRLKEVSAGMHPLSQQPARSPRPETRHQGTSDGRDAKALLNPEALDCYASDITLCSQPAQGASKALAALAAVRGAR